MWVEEVRKAAFEADNLGEAAVEFRNKNELPDIAPGVAPVSVQFWTILLDCAVWMAR